MTPLTPGSRRGASAVSIVAVVIVIAVVAGGAFVVLRPGTPTPSSSSTSGTHTASQSSSSRFTSSTTGPSASTKSTTATSTSLSCETTTTTGSSAGFLNFTSTFTDYSAMSASFAGTYNGTAGDSTSDYKAVSYGSGFKVDVTLTSNGTTTTFTDWVSRNGTAIAVYYEGTNYTGFYAESFYISSMSTFYFANLFGTPEILAALTDPSLVHVSAHGTTAIGPTQVSFTNYTANSIPLTGSSCGTSVDYSAFALQTGVPAGKSGTLLLYLDISGTMSGQGTSQSMDFAYRVTSITESP